MESDDFDSEAYPVPKKSVVDTLLRRLRGIESAPDNYFSTMHTYKYGTQGIDIAKAICEFKYPEDRRAEIETFVLNMLLVSEIFFRNIVELILSQVQKLLVPKGPAFRDNIDETLAPSDVNRQQRVSAVSLFCALWRYGMIAKSDKLEELVGLLARESFTILRQVISQYSSLPPRPANLSEAKRITLSSYVFNGAYHPTYFTSAFLHTFLCQTVEDGFGISPLHGEITNNNINTPCTPDKHTPMLISQEERNSLIHHIAMLFQLDTSHDALALVPAKPLIPREELSTLPRGILSCFDYMIRLFHVEYKIYALFKETVSILSQEFGALSKESLCDGELEWGNHLCKCNTYFCNILNTLGLNMIVPTVLNQLSVSPRSTKAFITSAFDLCPSERERYVSIINFESGKLADVYTNEISEIDSLRRYPLSLTQSYRVLEDKYKENLDTVYALLNKDIQKAIDSVFKQYYDSTPRASSIEKLQHLLFDPKRTTRIGINPGDITLLLQSIRNQTEEHVIILLLVKFLNFKDTTSIITINSVFRQVFCRRFAIPETYCHYYAHLYACLCINRIIPIVGPLQTDSDEHKLYPAHIQCQNALSRILINEDRDVERDDATFHLIRCVNHLSCFNLLKIKDLISCMTKASNRLSRVEQISFKSKRLIMTLYNIIYHNYYFWYSSCPEICINVNKIHSIVSDVVKRQESKAIKDWYEVLVNVRYKPLLAHIDKYIQEQQERKGSTPNLERIHEEYSNSVRSYLNTNSGRFTHSLAYQWLKKRLLSFLKEAQPLYSKQLDTTFPQYITSLLTRLNNDSRSAVTTTSSSEPEDNENGLSYVEDFSASTVVSMEDILLDLRNSIIAHFSPNVEPLLHSFLTKTLSLLNFTDLSHGTDPIDFLPAGFYDRIYKEIKEKYDKHNRFHHIENDYAMYNDRLLPPAPTPHELSTVFLSLDVLSSDTVRPLAALITCMHHSDSKNLQIGSRRIMAALMDTLESAIAIGNEQQASATGLLLVELVKLGMVEYSAISNVVSTFILSSDCIFKLSSTHLSSYGTELDSLWFKLDKKLIPLSQEFATHENLYIDQQQEYTRLFNKYKFLSLEQQLGYRISYPSDSGIRSSNMFALGMQMMNSFIHHFVTGMIAHFMGIPECASVKVSFALKEEILRDYVKVCLYSQCRQCEITALLSNLLDETVKYSNVLIDAKQLINMQINLAIFSETITSASKFVVANDFSYRSSLKPFCDLIRRFLVTAPSAKME